MWADDAVAEGVITKEERDIVYLYVYDVPDLVEFNPEHFDIAQRLYLWQLPTETMTCHCIKRLQLARNQPKLLQSPMTRLEKVRRDELRRSY